MVGFSPLLAAGQDHSGGHAVRQVQVTTPAVAIAVHVGDEPDSRGVLDGVVDCDDAQAR
jgi:hypothetical protein